MSLFPIPDPCYPCYLIYSLITFTLKYILPEKQKQKFHKVTGLEVNNKFEEVVVTIFNHIIFITLKI